ncbi:putative ubiquitin-conjugating enzyme protein 17 [Aphelenchoides fujianensis]|nr:putative ubiquitin-conjugating enzyme protein 17 [Aphelenchoides fujianensis]
MERTVEERIAQEEHLMWLLCALTTFLCGDSIKLAELTPDFELPREQPISTAEAADELANSVLLELIAYHLQNDSALMEATTALAFIPLFLPRLVAPKDAESRSIAKDVLPRFRATLNQYLNSIRGQQSPDSGFIDFCRRSNDMIEVIKKLAQRYEQRLPPEKRVKTAVIGHRSLRTAAGLSDQQPLELGIPATSLYVDLLQPLQITTQRLIGDDGKPIHSFAFKKELRSVNPFASSLKERTKRIAKELASLHSGLPLSASSSIFLCVDEARCDVLKVLITGPSKTPYENGLFEFDVFFPSNYPNSPPKVSFLTTGGGQIRFNPNLYADGKDLPVAPEHVLVSIQGLIFVENPYFNEPGFEKFANSPKGQDFSTRYNSHIQMATFTYAISQMAKNPPVYFKDVIRRHLWLKREAIVEQAERWLNETLLDAPPMGIENDPDSGSSDSYMNPIVQRQNVQKLIGQMKEMQNPLESQEFL